MPSPPGPDGQAAGAEPGRPRVPDRAGRSIPCVVWLTTGLFLLVAVWQSALFPNFRSPDEREHVDLIVQVNQAEAWPWPAPGTLSVSKGLAAGGFTVGGRFRQRLHLADRAIPPRDERPSYLDAGGAEPAGRWKNHLIQHPPLYYLAGSLVLKLIPDWQHVPFDRVYLILRLWNVLLMLWLPMLCWATARRLGLPDPVPVAAALVPVAIPELTRSASSVNNDNLLVPLLAVLTLLVARVLTGDVSRRTALAVGAVGSLALLTKGFGLVIPVWVAAVYLATAVRSRRPGALASLAIAWAAMLPGVGWWVRNKVVYSTVQPHGTFTEPPDLSARYGWSDGGREWAERFIERMNTTFFVHDQSAQRLQHWPWRMAVVAGALVLVALVVVLALGVLPRLTTVLLFAPVPGFFAIVAKGSWEYFAATHRFSAMQGRYLFGGVVAVAVVAVAATARLPAAARRWVPLGVFASAVAIQCAYLTYTLWLFWEPSGSTGVSALRASYDAITRWYALPDPAVRLIRALIAVAVALTAVAVIRLGIRGPRRPPEPVMEHSTPREREPELADEASRAG